MKLAGAASQTATTLAELEATAKKAADPADKPAAKKATAKKATAKKASAPAESAEKEG